MALRRGARGDLVRYYQAALRQRQIELGVPALALLEVDGDYGPDTEAAVREYQLAADVEQTGIIDGAVAAAIARYHPEIRLHAHTGTAVPQHPHTATITLT
jgi:peptidoglycan hydrolase-like protein with peptidoglycan-binding domain